MNIENYTVTQVVEQIKALLEGEFRKIVIEGEISNLTRSSSGHWYFSLSDKDSVLGCALFKMDAFRNPLIKKLSDGDKVKCLGGIGVYTKRGTFQLIVKQVVKIGAGDLAEQFKELKRKLAQEGLFDMEVKLPIPALPRRVAVVTALGAAALQDFINIYQRRGLWMDLLVVPALVQGELSPPSLISALKKIQKYNHAKSSDSAIDLVVLTRGGGSMEDLWAFNSEELARVIYDLKIPVISAVGHQVDYTICDYVADLRCETPSAAAEVITHQQTRLKELLANCQKHLHHSMKITISEKIRKLEATHPRQLAGIIWNKYNSYQKRVSKCNITDRLFELTRIHELQIGLDEASVQMKHAMDRRLDEYKAQMKGVDNLLRVLNPQNVLERGYSFIKDENGKIIGSQETFQGMGSGDQMKVIFCDGEGKVAKV